MCGDGPTFDVAQFLLDLLCNAHSDATVVDNCGNNSATGFFPQCSGTFFSNHFLPYSIKYGKNVLSIPIWYPVVYCLRHSHDYSTFVREKNENTIWGKYIL